MKKRNAKSKPKVKRVKLTPTAVIEVVVPKAYVPVAVTDPDKGVVKIIPVPAAKLRDKTWLERWFG